MAAMNPHHAAALALVGWYLMLPPLRPVSPEDVSDRPVDLTVPPDRPMADLTAPFSQWTIIKTFPTEKECRVQAKAALSEYRFKKTKGSSAPTGYQAYPARDLSPLEQEKDSRCIATDDPRLKEK
jgi:hypothetical protein